MKLKGINLECSPLARVVVSPQGVIDACLIPAFIESPGHPVLTGEPPCGPGTDRDGRYLVKTWVVHNVPAESTQTPTPR